MPRVVTFKNRTINMVGNPSLPNNFNESEQYPAIARVHPGVA
jgi:hypothetical protein